MTQRDCCFFIRAAKTPTIKHLFAQKVLSVNINTHRRAAWCNALDNKGVLNVFCTMATPKSIGFAPPPIDSDTIAAVTRVLRSGWITSGPELAAFEEELAAFLTVRPGLTDPASIAGFDEGARLEAADDPEQHYREVILPEKVAQQLAYVRSATFGSDIRIIARTLFRIFKR